MRSNRISPSCLGEPILNSLPASLWISFSSAACCLGEIVGQLAQQVGIDGDAGPLHIGQHHHQRPFQRLIDAALAAFRASRGLSSMRQPQGHIGIFGGIFGGLRDRHAVEGDLVLALAGHFAKGDGRVRQMQLAEFVHAMAVQPAFQHIGHQHGVIDRIEPDAALQEHQRVIFQVLADLQDAIVFQQRLQPRQHIGLGHLDDGVAAVLRGRQIQRKPVALAMAAGNVTGLARRHRQRHAAKPRGHGIKRGGFGIDTDQPGLARPRDPAVQVFADVTVT